MRNQGLRTRPNPHIDEGVPPWGLPPHSRAEQDESTESQLRNSDAAKDPQLNLWVYDNTKLAADLYLAALIQLFLVTFSILVVGGCWLSILLSDINVLLMPLLVGMIWTFARVCANTIYVFDDHLAANWLLGMEHSRKAKVVEGDERRWSGEMIFAP